MTLGLAFWVLMIIWLFFGWFRDDPRIPYGPVGHTLLLFALLFLLGWHSFGFIIH